MITVLEMICPCFRYSNCLSIIYISNQIRIETEERLKVCIKLLEQKIENIFMNCFCVWKDFSEKLQGSKQKKNMIY